MKMRAVNEGDVLAAVRALGDGASAADVVDWLESNYGEGCRVAYFWVGHRLRELERAGVVNRVFDTKGYWRYRARAS